MTAFDLALKFTLFSEGGYSDNPADSGGPTNYGITQGTWDAYCASKGNPSSPVSGIKLLTATAIYDANYWDAAHCGAIPEKMGIALFDWAVNHGVYGAVFTLQAALSVAADGNIGPITIKAANTCPLEPTLLKFLDLRREWYKQDVLNIPSQIEFLDGWMNRVNNLQEYLAKL
jgi:lysozyme family protein